eukprot:SM000023S07668  [mRNA]  locus=s23:715231:716224:- [translate_table: standard]
MSTTALGAKFDNLHMRPYICGRFRKEQNPVQCVAATARPAAGNSTTALLFWVGLPLILGFISSIKNSPNTQWSENLRKPSWQPPAPIFGGAWSVLYPLMGYAAMLVAGHGGIEAQSGPLLLYAVQLVLNLLWPYFFFNEQNIAKALIDISALLVLVLLTWRSFRSVSVRAGNLFFPYVVWVAFATLLNYDLYKKNGRGDGSSAIQGFGYRST